MRLPLSEPFFTCRSLSVAASVAFCLFCHPAIPLQAQLANIRDVPSDLTVPSVTRDKPAAGKRVLQVLPGFETWNLHHVLYLPVDWNPDEKHPVIVEYPGNGGYQNSYGDKCTGRVEDCKLGYGISDGRQFVWLCLPFIDTKAKKHALKWWGDAEATASYCRDAVQRVCQDFGGDSDRVILTGFSRGAIACNYIGLRDDKTASLWRAMVVHSHYDGVRRWGYPDDDQEAARNRLQRFNGRPQFVTQEKSIDDIREFLIGSAVNATLTPIPYPNHTDTWVLKDIPVRTQLRKWLAQVLE